MAERKQSYNFRLPPALHDVAKAKAEGEFSTLTDIVQRALLDYVGGPEGVAEGLRAMRSADLPAPAEPKPAKPRAAGGRARAPRGSRARKGPESASDMAAAVLGRTQAAS